MDIKRAQEIMESHGVIGVRYREAPVWLERIHEDTGMIEVKDLESERRMEVPAAALFEDGLAEYGGPS